MWEYAAGDFNSSRSEALYRYMRRGRLEGGYWEPFQRRHPVVETTEAHPFRLTDVYSELANFSMWYTYGRPSGACTIDYIWTSSALQVRGVLQYLTQRQAVEWQRRGIPHEQHPSDHLPLGVVVDVALSTPAVVDGGDSVGETATQQVDYSKAGRVELAVGTS
jgi:mRNA deadenylase 3'-5' endonuclease subunit Ccr4